MLERLQKIIARAGIASRRHAEQLIVSGQVRVNGQVVTELGSKADAEKDRIEAAGRLVENNERRVHIALNKPPEVVSTLADPEGRKTLRNLLKGLPERVYPVGRLDYDASGVMFLTNDGDLAAEMLKDWGNLEQQYHIKIKGRLLLEDLDRLGRNAGAVFSTIRQPDASRGHAENFWYEVSLQDSKKDILRRVLFAEKHPVEKLKRIALGPLNLEGLPQGRYRLLDEKEVAALRTALKIKPKPRTSFAPRVEDRESVPEQVKPFIQERLSAGSRAPNRGRLAAASRHSPQGKHGPRPSRPPGFDPAEDLEQESSPRDNFRPDRTGAPQRPPSTGRPFSPNRPAGPGRPWKSNQQLPPHQSGRPFRSGPTRSDTRSDNRSDNRSDAGRSGPPKRFSGPGGPPRRDNDSRGPSRFGGGSRGPSRPEGDSRGSTRGPSNRGGAPFRSPRSGNSHGPARPDGESRGPFRGPSQRGGAPFRPPRPGGRPQGPPRHDGSRGPSRPGGGRPNGGRPGGDRGGPSRSGSGGRPGGSSRPGGTSRPGGPGNSYRGKSSGKPFRPSRPDRDTGPRQD